jgi:hypothetical protein
VSHPHLLTPPDTRSALVATLGADFQSAVAPFKAEISALAVPLRGDLHRAAMRLLVERHGRRTTGMEQQLIVAALAELQDGATAAPPDVLSRVADRLSRFCDSLPAVDRPPVASA